MSHELNVLGDYLEQYACSICKNISQKPLRNKCCEICLRRRERVDASKACETCGERTSFVVTVEDVVCSTCGNCTREPIFGDHSQDGFATEASTLGTDDATRVPRRPNGGDGCAKRRKCSQDLRNRTTYGFTDWECFRKIYANVYGKYISNNDTQSCKLVSELCRELDDMKDETQQRRHLYQKLDVRENGGEHLEKDASHILTHMFRTHVVDVVAICDVTAGSQVLAELTKIPQKFLTHDMFEDKRARAVEEVVRDEIRIGDVGKDHKSTLRSMVSTYCGSARTTNRFDNNITGMHSLLQVVYGIKTYKELSGPGRKLLTELYAKNKLPHVMFRNLLEVLDPKVLHDRHLVRSIKRRE